MEIVNTAKCLGDSVRWQIIDYAQELAKKGKDVFKLNDILCEACLGIGFKYQQSQMRFLEVVAAGVFERVGERAKKYRLNTEKLVEFAKNIDNKFNKTNI